MSIDAMSCTNGKCWGCEIEYKSDRSLWCAFCFARPVYLPDYHLEEELAAIEVTDEDRAAVAKINIAELIYNAKYSRVGPNVFFN